MNRAPLVLDFDDSAGDVPGAYRLELSDWQEAIRFGCSTRQLRQLMQHVQPRLPCAYGTVLLGSGDYHHVSWPLIELQASRGPFQVIVFDNHPDNMRFPFGVHCGSWVQRVAALPHVSHVHVVGITSPDISAGHAWENHWRPLLRKRLTYWCMDVDVGWARRFGLDHAFLAFPDPDTLVNTFLREQAGTDRWYVSIDKDALAADAVRTNWDQGRLQERHLLSVIAALAGRVIGSDITGDISAWRYTTWWKRWLSALDGQSAIDPVELRTFQAGQQALNRRVVGALAASHTPN
ncbi:MAG TPA: hypothetical protein VFM34_11630 [Moraxellaceae bacterium]|nr:hypothetical protein [Moraxellaceae bacterium]